MQQILFFVSYLSLLTIPGYAISILLKTPNKIISSLGFSLVFFAFAFIIFSYLSLKAQTLYYFFSISVIVSIFFIITQKKHISFILKDALIITSTTLTLIFYQIFFGIFNEVPSDFFSHLGFYQTTLSHIQQNNLGSALQLPHYFLQKTPLYYFLPAITQQHLYLQTIHLVPIIIFCNNLLFLIATFYFAKNIFTHTKQPYLFATISVMLIFLHLGINVFSYIRYYAFAPTMLCMILYYLAITLGFKSIKNTLLVVVLILASAAIHKQEAIFISVVMAIMLLFQPFIKKKHFCPSPILNYLFLFTASIGFFTLYYYGITHFHRTGNLHHRLWEFAPSFSIFPAITTLNLSNQFIQVITLWGIVVYILFFLHIRRYKNNLFILAGMLSPLFTILNPFFVDIFLRLYDATGLWRLCYIIPIHYVGADMLIYYSKRYFTVKKRTKIVSVIVVSLLILLLLPIYNTNKSIHYSRIPTLKKTQHETSPSYYQDILFYLNTFTKKQSILTDPMTGYMITGLTQHNHKRTKFSRGRYFEKFSFLDYSQHPLNKYAGHLLIINKRKKPISTIGKLAKHWHSHEWKNARYYYPQALLTYLQQNPNSFPLLWENNGVSVYRVHAINP